MQQTGGGGVVNWKLMDLHEYDLGVDLLPNKLQQQQYSQHDGAVKGWVLGTHNHHQWQQLSG